MKSRSQLISTSLALIGLGLLGSCANEGKKPSIESLQPCAGGVLVTDSARTDWWYRQENPHQPDVESFHTGWQFDSTIIQFPPEELDPTIYMKRTVQRYGPVYSVSNDEINALKEGDWITPRVSLGKTTRRTNVHELIGNGWETHNLEMHDGATNNDPIELCMELTNANTHGMNWYARSKER